MDKPVVKKTIILQIEAEDYQSAWLKMLQYMKKAHRAKEDEVKCLKKTKDSNGAWWFEVENPRYDR
ncbi:MAG TPA: hypothetical protein PLC99_13475 [Verrucomicrobiota bacterium]|nr:hypothetical protein [Verrucomicrobiota bacterium]